MMSLSNCTASYLYDLSPSPSGIITSDAKVKDLIGCRRTSRNILMFFATSYANLARVIGWRLAAWFVVKILNVYETRQEAEVFFNFTFDCQDGHPTIWNGKLVVGAEDRRSPEASPAI